MAAESSRSFMCGFWELSSLPVDEVNAKLAGGLRLKSSMSFGDRLRAICAKTIER